MLNDCNKVIFFFFKTLKNIFKRRRRQRCTDCRERRSQWGGRDPRRDPAPAALLCHHPGSPSCPKGWDRTPCKVSLPSFPLCDPHPNIPSAKGSRTRWGGVRNSTEGPIPIPISMPIATHSCSLPSLPLQGEVRHSSAALHPWLAAHSPAFCRSLSTLLTGQVCPQHGTAMGRGTQMTTTTTTTLLQPAWAHQGWSSRPSEPEQPWLWSSAEKDAWVDLSSTCPQLLRMLSQHQCCSGPGTAGKSLDFGKINGMGQATEELHPSSAAFGCSRKTIGDIFCQRGRAREGKGGVKF